MIRFALATILALSGFAASAQNAGSLDTVPLESTPLPAQPYIEQTVRAAAPLPQPAQGAPALRETHGDWEIRCISQSDCVMTQMHQRSANSADAVFTVVKPNGLTDANGAPITAFAEIVVPLGVYLPGGLGLKVDANPARAAPFERCIDEGCVVRAPISSGMVDAMRQGSTVNIVIFGAPEKPIQIPISLRGFTAAFDAI